MPLEDQSEASFNDSLSEKYESEMAEILEELKKDAVMKIHLNTRITNKVPLILDYRLDLTSEVDQFWVQCHVDPFEASVLNEFLGSQFFIEFKSVWYTPRIKKI